MLLQCPKGMQGLSLTYIIHDVLSTYIDIALPCLALPCRHPKRINGLLLIVAKLEGLEM